MNKLENVSRKKLKNNVKTYGIKILMMVRFVLLKMNVHQKINNIILK